jgi:hypothetical protein
VMQHLRLKRNLAVFLRPGGEALYDEHGVS